MNTEWPASDLDSVRRSHDSRLCLIAWLVLAGFWLLLMQHFPWRIDSDDAMNFANGIERFSVLEFRPHFPGYPGMMLGASVIDWVLRPEASGWAVIAFSMLGAACIPLLLALICLHLTARCWLSMTVLVLAITSPMLAGLGLSGLSDAPALALVLAAILAVLQRRYWLAGVLLGAALAVRPSYLLLVLPVLAGVGQEAPGSARRTALMRLLWPIVLIGLACLLFLLAQDGLAWFAEGKRFVLGHFQIWGHSALSEPDAPAHWLDQLHERIGLAPGLLLGASIVLGLIQKDRAIRWLSAVAGIYLGVMLLTQNPHNLRHVAPVFFIGLLLLVVVADRCGSWLASAPFSQRLASFPERSRREHLLRSLVLVVPLGVMGSSFVPIWIAATSASPMLAAIAYLKDRAQAGTDAALGVNHQVNLVRAELPHLAIYDLYYPSQLFMLRHRAHAQRWRLSTTELHDSFYRLEQQFMWRFPTERSVYLYRLIELIN